MNNPKRERENNVPSPMVGLPDREGGLELGAEGLLGGSVVFVRPGFRTINIRYHGEM